jgi:hypothetical protein
MNVGFPDKEVLKEEIMYNPQDLAKWTTYIKIVEYEVNFSNKRSKM